MAAMAHVFGADEVNANLTNPNWAIFLTTAGTNSSRNHSMVAVRTMHKTFFRSDGRFGGGNAGDGHPKLGNGSEIPT